MAVYIYKCPICQKTIEITKSIFDNTEVPICQDCQIPMQRYFDSCNFSLKTKGFYSTDVSKK